MIPRAHITHWATGAPWPSELQIEQDLVLSRLIVEIANDNLLGQELAFRGGTCLHKVHLPTALRYSEDLDELMATKLRALYQRRKGRDLYDLWHVLVACDVDHARIAAGLEHYMRHATFTFPQLAQNLMLKLDDPDSASDLDTLVSTRPNEYVLAAAADLVMEHLGACLRNAPGIKAIRGGAWRA